MEQLQAQLLICEQVLITAIVGIAIGYAIKGVKKLFAYLETKTSLIKDDELREIAESTLESVDNLLITNITAVDQTLKPALLQSISDGVISKDELKSLSTIVQENTLKQLTTGATEILNTSVGDVNSYLANRTELLLSNLKLDETSAVSKTEISTPEVVTEKVEEEVKTEETVADTIVTAEVVNSEEVPTVIESVVISDAPIANVVTEPEVVVNEASVTPITPVEEVVTPVEVVADSEVASEPVVVENIVATDASANISASTTIVKTAEELQVENEALKAQLAQVQSVVGTSTGANL